MGADANPGPSGDADVPAENAGRADDLARFTAIAEALADGVEAALGPWVQRCVATIAEAWRPGLAAEVRDDAAHAAAEATAVIAPEVRAALLVDGAGPAASPLAIVRTAVRYPTAVLTDAGVPGVVRDEFEERTFPEDRYGLSPASFGDLDPALAELGLRWGAAKAHLALQRRRP